MQAGTAVTRKALSWGKDNKDDKKNENKNCINKTLYGLIFSCIIAV